MTTSNTNLGLTFILSLVLLIYVPGCAHTKKAAEALPFETVPIPGGSYTMGDVFEGDDPDATPVHVVLIGTFELSRYETTFDQYDAYATATGTALPEDNGYGRGARAVTNITWYNALAYCQHYGFRLPTEAEWEYAAREAGLPIRYPGTDDEKAADEYIRHIDNSVMHSFAVGTKEPNQLGLYDMGGNAYEWIGDYYEFYPDAGTEPVYKDLDVFSMRIIRGGSFKMNVATAQTFRRSGTLAEITSDTIGFRCARTVE